MKVPFVDLAAQYDEIRDEVKQGIEAVMDTTSFVLGPAVSQFEAEFAEYCETTHAVGVASGADALHLALRALDIGPGDEVITVANTFVATVNAIALAGATPVLADIDEATHNIHPEHVEAAITPKTKAILPVHLYGQPAEMDPILALGEKHGIPVVEDSAQAHGARYKGKRAGSMGRCGCFSFYPGKNLGAYGEGGAVTTSDGALAERLRMYRNCGQSEKYVHDLVGFNSRLDSMQAAVLNVKLKHLDGWNARRREVADRYAEGLAGTSLILPHVLPHAESVWHLYAVRHDERDGLMAYLKEREIFCGIHYPIPNHEQKAYAGVRTVPEGAPVTSRVAKELISLPMHPNLSDAQVDAVIAAVREYEGV